MQKYAINMIFTKKYEIIKKLTHFKINNTLFLTINTKQFHGVLNFQN